MGKILAHEVCRGWKAAANGNEFKVLGSGKILDVNARVRVVNGESPGRVVGDPFLAWAPTAVISSCGKKVEPADNLRMWQALNRMDADHMKSLSLFAIAEDSGSDEAEKRLEYAFIACALRMVSTMRMDIALAAGNTLEDFCKLAGEAKRSPAQIWGGKGWKALPEASSREIMSVRCEGVALGWMFRHWHDSMFAARRIVEVWPIEADKGEPAPFQSSIDRGAPIRPYLKKKAMVSGKGGSETWRNLSVESLERLVWILPRQRLAKMFSVSDMAISKRCKRDNIAQPPRGYWQKVAGNNGADVYDFLMESGVIPPSWWSVEISRQAYEEEDEDELAERILVVAAE